LTRPVTRYSLAWPVAHPVQPQRAALERTTVLPEKTAKNDRAEAPLIPKNRAIRILAKSIFRELQTQGYDEKQIVSLATELLSEVTQKMASAPSAKSQA
jgi:hypothetical protein